MRPILLVLIAFLLVVIGFAFGIFLSKKPLPGALAAFVTLFGTVVTSAFTPSADGEADIDLILGPFGHITAKYMKINPHEPMQHWYAIFGSIVLLNLIA